MGERWWPVERKSAILQARLCHLMFVEPLGHSLPLRAHRKFESVNFLLIERLILGKFRQKDVGMIKLDRQYRIGN